MRFCAFSLNQLKPLHQGVQNSHILGELIAKYVADASSPKSKYDMLIDWAVNHKTIIFYDGGFAAGLETVRRALLSCPYPWSEFYEDEATLSGIMTSVGVVLPAAVYEAADHLRKGGVLNPPSQSSGKVFFKEHVLSMWDIEFIQEVLLQSRLAS